MVPQKGTRARNRYFQFGNECGRRDRAAYGSVDCDPLWMALGVPRHWTFADLVWLACWLATYRRPEEQPRLSHAEFEYIRSRQSAGTGRTRIPWSRLFPYRQTWAFAAGKFLTDPIWWFYLFWLPKFLNQTHGLTLAKIGLPLVFDLSRGGCRECRGRLVVFVAAETRPGWSVNRSRRKTSMLICACAVTPVFFASMTSHLWVIVALVGMAAAGHQGWSGEPDFATVGDMFPAASRGVGGGNRRNDGRDWRDAARGGRRD